MVRYRGFNARKGYVRGTIHASGKQVDGLFMQVGARHAGGQANDVKRLEGVCANWAFRFGPETNEKHDKKTHVNETYTR